MECLKEYKNCVAPLVPTLPPAVVRNDCLPSYRSFTGTVGFGCSWREKGALSLFTCYVALRPGIIPHATVQNSACLSYINESAVENLQMQCPKRFSFI